MKYYCIGIKGTGMSTLAQMLYDMGNEVSVAMMMRKIISLQRKD